MGGPPDSLHPSLLPHLQLDDGPELTPRRVSDHHQLARDDDWLEQVEALVRFGGCEVHRPQHAGRAGCLTGPRYSSISMFSRARTTWGKCFWHSSSTRSRNSSSWSGSWWVRASCFTPACLAT